MALPKFILDMFEQTILSSEAEGSCVIGFKQKGTQIDVCLYRWPGDPGILATMNGEPIENFLLATARIDASPFLKALQQVKNNS